jgi:LmbE family N-acetylglucosaminyl deacetylase
LKILLLAAHADDEVLGMGATIKKLSKKNEFRLVVLTESVTSQYTEKKMLQTRRNACLKSAKVLGIKNVLFLDFPDNQLDSVPQLKINDEIENIIRKFKPSVVYSPPPNDLNKDHQKVFESSLVTTRPFSSSVKSLLCYELPGMVRKPFNPSIYENIAKEFSYKIKAFKMYKNEVMNFPHPRSIEAIENLAIQRGVESSLKKAEAFRLIHSIKE